MNPSISVCIASYNAVDALKLAVKSLMKHHQRDSLRLLITDNDSTDGARDYAKSVSDVFFDQPEKVEHGTMLDRMVESTDTQFVLTMDNDVEVLAPVLNEMQVAIQNGAFCCCPSSMLPGNWVHRWFDFIGVQMVAQPRIDPCFALFNGDELRKLVNHFGFGTYRHYPRGEFYDTGSMLLKVSSNILGKRTVAMPEHRIIHYGSVSSNIRGSKPDQEKLNSITQRLGNTEPIEASPPEAFTKIDNNYRLQTVHRSEYETDADPNGINPVYYLALRMCNGTGIDIGGSISGRLNNSIIPGATIADPALAGTGSATDLSNWTNNSVDYVVSSHCLEHVDEPEKCLREVYRVLKPGGISFFYLPHHSHVGWNPKLHEGCRPAHKWQPDSFGMGRLFLMTGLDIVLLEQDCDNWDGFLAIGRKPK